MSARLAIPARACALAALVVALVACTRDGPVPPAALGRAFTVTSAAFAAGETIPDRHTCADEDISPPLAWADAPADTVEIAVLLEDPDAPAGTFVHWVGAGIDPASGGLAEGEAPPVEGGNDFGSRGYRGPCPPEGDQPHSYVFTVFAAGEPLELEPGSSADELAAALEDTELGRGQLVGRYARP